MAMKEGRAVVKAQLAWAILALLAGAQLCIIPLGAQMKTPTGPIEKLSGTTVDLDPGAGETVTIDILHWSTDADREHLVAAFSEKGDPAALQTALSAIASVGYIWTKSESIGYTLRYAQRVPLPGGGDRILLATDRRLGVWTRGNIWKHAGHADAPDYPFTLVELHLSKQGIGEGKMSISSPIAVDQTAKVIALATWATAPVLLKAVKTEHVTVGTSN